MRLIDADELIVMEYGGIKFIPVEFINDAPTIDAVPVVRCKDCTYRDSVLCPLLNLNEDEDYCSLGERKEYNE